MHKSCMRLLSFIAMGKSKISSGEPKICGLQRDTIEILEAHTQSHTKSHTTTLPVDTPRHFWGRRAVKSCQLLKKEMMAY